MKIHRFKNGTGTITGVDTQRIYSDASGILQVGAVALAITNATEGVAVPRIKDGIYCARFVSGDNEYSLGNIKVRNGFISPQKIYTDIEIRLMHRVDELEEKVVTLEAKTNELDSIFDTDSLNFLIK